MRRTITYFIFFIIFQCLFVTVEADNNKSQLSYALGVQIGDNMKRLSIVLDLDRVYKGFKDAYTGKRLEMTESQIAKVVMEHQKDLREKQALVTQEMSEKNRKDGEAYLVANAKKPGVTVTDSGLQYRVIKSGQGSKPKEGDQVQVIYKGRFVNGTEFDSSDKSGSPITFSTNQVIPGWQEALLLMQEGARWEIAIPPPLAYGPKGSGRAIGPNMTLIFEIELVKVNSVSDLHKPGDINTN